MVEHPWPESPEVTEARVRGLVESVLEPHELDSFSLDWVTPQPDPFGKRDNGWTALRVTITAVDDEVFEKEIWGADWCTSWQGELDQLASDLEDWVCETTFAWGQQRTARVPD